MKRLIKCIFLVFACALLITACKSVTKPGGYGSLQGDKAVSQAFVAGEIKPNLNYYYLGSEATPYVIIGVRRDLILDNSQDWRTLEPQMPGYLSNLTKMMYDNWRQRGDVLQGFRIIDHNGRYLGDWYSIWDIYIINPVVLSKDEQHIEIYPPRFPRLEPSPGGSQGAR